MLLLANVHISILMWRVRTGRTTAPKDLVRQPFPFCWWVLLSYSIFQSMICVYVCARVCLCIRRYLQDECMYLCRIYECTQVFTCSRLCLSSPWRFPLKLQIRLSQQLRACWHVLRLSRIVLRQDVLPDMHGLRDFHCYLSCTEATNEDRVSTCYSTTHHQHHNSGLGSVLALAAPQQSLTNLDWAGLISKSTPEQSKHLCPRSWCGTASQKLPPGSGT